MATSVVTGFVFILLLLQTHALENSPTAKATSFRSEFTYGGDNEPGQSKLSQASNLNPLCSIWRGQICFKCSNRSYFDSKGTCVSVSPLCQSFDSANGKCLTCYGGYTLQRDTCVSETQKQVDPLCKEWRDGACLSCADRSFMNDKRLCQLVSPNCKNYRQNDGACTSCYSGFTLQNGKCIQSASTQPVDGLCAQTDSLGKCVACANRSYLNSQSVCKPVSPQCNEYDRQTGACKTCYSGYELREGKCEVSKGNGPSDTLCSKWSNTECTECVPRSFLNNQKKCEQVDGNCQQYVRLTGECLICYRGYKLQNKRCVVEGISSNEADNGYCTGWSQNKKCVSCAPGTYLGSDGYCMLVDPQCRQYSKSTGQCFECYGGYELTNGKCVVAYFKSVNTVEGDLLGNPLCSQWKTDRCISCSPRSYFNSKGICELIDPNCQEYSQEKRQCIRCYAGYQLSQSKQTCIVAKIKSQPENTLVNQGYSDPLCAQWASPTKCTKCATDAFLNTSTAKCQRKDQNCKRTDILQEWKCMECYQGWTVVEGKCFSFKFDIKESIRESSPWMCQHWLRGVCLKCSKDFAWNPVSKKCECGSL